jgi:hypothetical protein
MDWDFFEERGAGSASVAASAAGAARAAEIPRIVGVGGARAVSVSALVPCRGGRHGVGDRRWLGWEA